MTVTNKTSPASEPVTLQEAKDHLRVDGSDEDAQINRYIKTARQSIEDTTGLCLGSRTVQLMLDRFPAYSFGMPAPIVFPRNPVTEVRSVYYWQEVDKDEHDDADAARRRSVITDVENASDITYFVQKLMDSDAYEYSPTAGYRQRFRIWPHGSQWPAKAYNGMVDSITVTCQCGLSKANTPGPVLSALLLLIGDLYLFRENIGVGRSFGNSIALKLLLPYCPQNM